MKKGQKKRRSVILRRVLALLLAIVLIHSQIMPAVFAADTNYSQESNTEEKTVVDGAETVLPMSEDAISEPSEPIQSEEQQTEDKVSEDTTVESSEPIQSGEQQTEDAADAEQSPEVETTGEAAEETVNIADAVVPVTVNYYLPKSQNLQVDAPESYTEGEAQEEAKSAVIEQALGDETTQKLIEQQKEKGIESNTQELTASAVSEEEYDSYTQMAVTGEGLQAPEVSLSDDVQLEEDADAENTNPLIGWQVAKTAGIMLSYPDGTEIKMGDVIPADKISEVQMTAADDGISLLSTQANMSIASLIALTQDMTVVQRVGPAGTNGKWSVLVQGGTNQMPSAGTVRHAYGTLENALIAINTDTTSNSFKITFLDNYTANSNDISAMGSPSSTSGVLGKRTTNKPTIVFTGATNYSTGISYSSWTTFTSQKQRMYFNGFNAYFTHVNLDWSGSTVYGNQNDTTFDDVKFVGGAVTAIYGGRFSGGNSTNVSYNLKFEDVEMTKDAPVKKIFGGGQDNSTGTINLTMTNCTIYGNVYASSGPYNSTTYTHTGDVHATLQDTAIRKFDTTVVDPMLKPKEVHTVGGSFWGLYGKVTGDLELDASGSYVAECGTWFTAKEGCTAGSISYRFNDIKESLRFVGAYEHAGYDQATTSKGYIEVNNTQVANVFGWGYLRLNNSVTCDGGVSNFGHMQYDSSFYHYWTEQKKQDAKGGDRYVPKDYKPDLPTCIGYVATKSSTICSGGDCYEAWNRQRFGRIVLEDNYNTFQIYNAMGGNSTNVVDVDYLDRISDSYKATIELMGRQANTSASSAFSMIHIRGNYFSTSVKAIGTLKTHTNVTCTMAQDTTNRLIKLYATTKAQNIIYLYSGSSITGNALYSADSFAEVLDRLRKQSGGTYTLWFTRGYSLINKDVTAFNNATGFANKNVTIICEGAIAGSNERNSPSTGLRLWDQVFPNFNSLTWKNVEFRSDFYEFNKYSFVMHGNGHNLTFENCRFTGDVTINAGGNSTQGTSGSTLTLKNCVNVNVIYAAKQQEGLGNTTINVESCTGYTGTEGGFITIDPAQSSVKNLNINLKDCVAKVVPSYTYYEKVRGDYKLTAENAQLMFTNPSVTSGHTAKVYLNKDSSDHEVVLLGDCYGAEYAPAGSSSLSVTAKVRPKDATSVNLDYFDQIEINGGELHLGDSANLVEGGFGSSSRAADVSLENSGKLMLDYLSSTSMNRTINSLTTDGTNTEVSVTYDYKGETSPSGRPLIIKNALTVPSYSKLRISTTLPPRHKGTVEYPLIQFNSSNNAKLEQYNWIADKQYYLTIGSQNSNQIVLRADTYAPLVYQAKTTNMSMSLSGNQIGQLEIYLKDLYRDGIDKSGYSINDASDGAYPTGFQVYLSTQDVQLKDGVYGYTYNSSTDIQLKSANVSSYGWMNSGSFIDINGTSVTATTKSPVLHLKLNSRIYQANTNYFIYARDNAGNWSKFLLDTKGPTSTYTNITSKKVSDGTYSYTFTGLKFTDPIQTATYGTSDIADVSYNANATQYIQSSKKIAEVRYNKTGLDPWSGNTYTSATVNSSTGACTLSNVSVSVTEKLYVFVKDGYGNISKFTYVPIVFDAQSGGATSTGKFSDGSTTSSTLGLVGSTLKSAQVPSSPVLGNQTFRYWYNSTNSGKSQVFLTSVTVSGATTYYPQWTYPTLTISNQITGSTADKSKIFTYTIAVNNESGTAYSGKSFSYTGGTVDGETGVTAPANGIASSNSSGEIKISLSHGQKVTIQLPGYYDQVKVTQSEISTYWTTYTTEADEKFNSNATENPISMDATNRSLAFVNSNDSSQPVIYQQKMEGEWTKDQGDNYGRKLTVYIRDLYGDGIDTQGSSFSTSEKAEFPGCRYAQVYLSTYDAPKADRGFKFRYTDTESVPLESLFSCRKLTSGSFTDIEGKTVTATSEKPIWEFKMFSTYKFDQNKNYFIYVRDLTGKWTKYLLDTKGPRIENTGIITKSKENDNDTEFKISKIQVKDEMIDVANGTSDLTKESQENFTYVANATKYKGTQVSLVLNNKTGKFSDTYKTPTKATDGTYTAVESMNNGEMLYVYAQDYYGNTTAQQYVLVGFDASGNAQYEKAIFKDKTKLKRELVAKGQKLSPSQIPSDPGFYNDTTSQKFTQWSDSTDPNKKKVDLKTAQMTKSVILNADYDKPSVIIKQMIKGDGIWNNQEFTYTVKTSYPTGKVIPCKGSYVSPAVSAPNITSLTVDANQEITFKLKAGQTLELIPGDNQYTIKSIIQDSNGTNCEIQKDAKVISSVENVDVNEISTNFVFTNTKNIVVTGVDGGNTDNSLLLVGLMGVLLITGVSVLRVRGRRRS